MGLPSPAKTKANRQKCQVASDLNSTIQMYSTKISPGRLHEFLWEDALPSKLALRDDSLSILSATATLTNITTIYVVGKLLDAYSWNTVSKGKNIKLPYTQVNKCNSVLGAYWLLSACFFPGFAPG